jgi:signal transduction histidine kinase
MVSRVDFTPSAEAMRPAGYPFRGPGTMARAAPFAAIAVLAEASLGLSPVPGSGWAVLVSVVLLLAWLTVLFPLAYTGSVLALILAAGSDSGVGIVILVPLVWTALFHRPWESACIVAAIVVVETVISLTPVDVGAAVLVRRLILWASLATMISVAAHGMRARTRHWQEETARLQDRLRDAMVLQDRDRIAADLQDRVIQRVFAAGLTLQGTSALIADPGTRRRVESAVDDLDEVIRVLRDAIFGLQHSLRGRGVKAAILALGGLDPATVSFAGPVDGVLEPAARAQLLDVLREALEVITPHSVPARAEVSARNGCLTAVIEATFRPGAGGAQRLADALPGLREAAARAGIQTEAESTRGGCRLSWQVTAGAGVQPRT